MSKKMTPNQIATSQGQGKWMPIEYLENTLLGHTEVKDNMLKRCVTSMNEHVHGAKADEHPCTRTYHVTSDAAFYRHGGTNMVRVTKGKVGRFITVSNNEKQIRIHVDGDDAAEQEQRETLSEEIQEAVA